MPNPGRYVRTRDRKGGGGKSPLCLVYFFITSYKDEESSITRGMYYNKDILAAGSAQSQLHMECLQIISDFAVKFLNDYVGRDSAMAEVVEDL